MIDYGIQKSTVKPTEILLDEFSVWVHSNIQPIQETVNGKSITIWQFEMKQYAKNEYILSLSTQLTHTQLGLVEVYELMGR